MRGSGISRQATVVVGAFWVLALAVPVVVSGAPVIAAPAELPTVVSHEQLSDRLHEFVLMSPALEREALVRVQVPSGYDDAPGRRWPLALLLHGRSEDGTTWSERTDLEQFDGMVIVTPEGGRVGWYTDWFDDSCCEPQRWESFHLGEVLPWAQATFRVAEGRSQRFVAGVSMGGFGAMSYASRHPDRFAGTAELSGFVDLMLHEVSGLVGVDGQSYQVAGTPPGSIFGPVVSEEVRWRGHNPVDLASNLAWTDLVLRHGNGLPGGRFGGELDPGETAIRETGISLHQRLTALGIDHVWDDYGSGVHTWPYWEWGLQVAWPRWLAIADAAAPDPVPFSYRTIEPSSSVYGWEVSIDREVLEFAELADVSPDGFTLTGSGAATVISAPWFEPGGTYQVVAGPEPARLTTADDNGRLHLEVDLGPTNTAQQYTAEADLAEALAGAGYFETVTVTIIPALDRARVDEDVPPLPATGGGALLVPLAVTALAVIATLRGHGRPGARRPARPRDLTRPGVRRGRPRASA